MRTFVVGDVLAVRVLRFQPKSGPPVQVTLTVGRPVPDPEAPDRAWMCPYQISGLGDEPVRAIFGIDAMQALMLALHGLPTDLRALAHDKSGSFLDGDEDLGLTQACRMHLD